eukprot:CAMPEP_0184485106 /NCGR_PEP_ID=MMETSP0113_2-20130426/6746_1 /TAXON_ID=91329 /ORGANISM="Norrisiella sphaerica, Strain BC52" /LENGTH=270 /DNA_ID=CAMNT_0026866397 /DNA_START=320 /DNA_END=1129 /DNA_ORIENTATION=+
MPLKLVTIEASERDGYEYDSHGDYYQREPSRKRGRTPDPYHHRDMKSHTYPSSKAEVQAQSSSLAAGPPQINAGHLARRRLPEQRDNRADGHAYDEHEPFVESYLYREREEDFENEKKLEWDPERISRKAEARGSSYRNSSSPWYKLRNNPTSAFQYVITPYSRDTLDPRPTVRSTLQGSEPTSSSRQSVEISAADVLLSRFERHNSRRDSVDPPGSQVKIERGMLEETNELPPENAVLKVENLKVEKGAQLTQHREAMCANMKSIIELR